ncbi:MAG: nitrile hydratase subunit beta [Burkholderiales bacterium RIFCSPLOWO2_12_FULL_64_99]|nr:MAG: nitrile hydratase subunit beta [Burkholderiales bacterium RIFCSPHIGHO2_12_FULL_63_20]OGB65245.1 MAG: nitrile hydratase subunit beta [Burkholderiales bacterium RIFCSPLOWO2_12_FULL_64_99]
MKLQHSLGGLQNLGPVNVEPRVFVQEWEKRIFGIHTVMMAESAHLTGALPQYPVDTLPTTFKETWTWASLRTGAESMQPFEYFKYRYYEKWLMGISQFFVDKGYIMADELASLTAHYRTQPDAPLPERPNEPVKQQITDYLVKGDSGLRPTAEAPRFASGQTVYVADPAAVDHTRLPGYLRNKKGTISEVYPGAYNYFVSTGPDGIGEPMPVYRVAFEAADIWGESLSEPNTTIYADLYEVYLKQANA